MAVKRIVPNIAAAPPGACHSPLTDPRAALAFYGDILGMTPVMDHGWIVTFAAAEMATPQISIAWEGGSGTPVPDLSIEVDDLDAIHRRLVAAGHAIEYGPAREPWGVRRLSVRDPFGRLLNILSHV